MSDVAVETSKGKLIALWILSVLAGLAFLTAGGSKVSSAPPMVGVFDKIGFGQGFRYLTGSLEILGAIGLFIPRFRFYAASLLALIVLSAVGFHLTILGGNPTAPIVLFVITVTIAWLSRPARA